MSFFKRQSRLQKLINISEELEFDMSDDNVKSCIIAVYMCDYIHDNNLAFTLMSAYHSQPSLFIAALESTREFQHILNLLNFELNNPQFKKVV